MQKGYYAAWNVDSMCPTYKSYSSDQFPMDIVFDREKFVSDYTYKGILTKEEDVDLFGNKEGYEMHEDWNFLILHNMKDEMCSDAIIQMDLDNIPHIENFMKIYIKPLPEQEE